MRRRDRRDAARRVVDGTTTGGLPVLFVRDKAGTLRAFLNVCRHRASPLCEEGETHAASLIRCPYHSWLYQLDGSLARAVRRRRARRLRYR